MPNDETHEDEYHNEWRGKFELDDEEPVFEILDRIARDSDYDGWWDAMQSYGSEGDSDEETAGWQLAFLDEMKDNADIDDLEELYALLKIEDLYDLMDYDLVWIQS